MKIKVIILSLCVIFGFQGLLITNTPCVTENDNIGADPVHRIVPKSRNGCTCDELYLLGAINEYYEQHAGSSNPNVSREELGRIKLARQQYQALLKKVKLNKVYWQPT